MKNKIFLLLTLSLAVQMAYANFTEGYYDQMDGKKKEALKTAAKQCVSSHTTLEYYDLPDYWQYSDVYPELVNGCKRWWEMYSDKIYLIQQGQSGTKSFSANKMQREHSVPKSWWKQNGSVEYTPAYSDMWNLYPSDGPANQAKLNYPFGEVRTATFDNGVSKVGSPMSGQGGGCANVFEPADEYKGDFARSMFYMATVYDDINWVINYMFQKNSYPTLVPWAVNMLLQWSREDPVSQKEIDRNDLVEQYQGNRNPFVDFPNLAEFIWGISTEEVFSVSEQAGSDPTPPITGDPEITSPANGSSLSFGQGAVGHTYTRELQITGHNFTSQLSVSIVGTNRDCFVTETTTIPAKTINENGGYLLTIRYTPKSIGEHSAKLTLYDGGLAGSVAVNLTGEGLAEPTLTALNAQNPTDLTDTGYTAHWSVATGEADFYVLTRVIYNDDQEESETYETNETFYSITGRDPKVAEAYYVSYSRLGILSPASNIIYVAASGINDVRDSAPYHVYGVEGGIYVSRAQGEAGTIVVYSLDGTIILQDESPADASVIPLKPGVYVVSVGGSRPQKLIVK